jgi:hypothetical protein
MRLLTNGGESRSSIITACQFNQTTILAKGPERRPMTLPKSLKAITSMPKDSYGKEWKECSHS